jgi:hypothetical protein
MRALTFLGACLGISLAICSVGFFMAAFTYSDPHENALRACLHASTSESVGSPAYESASLSCEALVSMREQAARSQP